MSDILDRARAYLGKLPPAVSGSGGHDATFKAALVLAKGFALPETEALPLLVEWNACCAPPWTERDLRHKLRDAANATAPVGYLLGNDRQSSSDEGAKKQALRAKWPLFTKGSPAELEAVARLRNLPSLAVRWADYFGVLRFCDWRGHRAFIVRPHEGDTFASARRLDGKPWREADGEEKKNIAMGGSEGRNRFLAMTDLGEGCPVLLTEGALGILETLAAIILADADASGWLPLSAVNDKCAFNHGMLERLRGRHVRIVPDNDQQGRDAAARWAIQLRDAGCRVDAVTLPEGCKDLGDVLARREQPAFDFRQLFS